MEELSCLDALGRRDFAKTAAAAGLLPFGLFDGGSSPSDTCPLQSIRDQRLDTLVAIYRAQIDALWQGQQGDCAISVANDVLNYASHLPYRMRYGLNIGLMWLDFYSFKHTMKWLKNHDIAGLRAVLNQGESRVHAGSPPMILWDEDHLLHMAVSGIAMLGRLVIHSRAPSRKLIGLGWSEICQDKENLVNLPAPPLADLTDSLRCGRNRQWSRRRDSRLAINGSGAQGTDS